MPVLASIDVGSNTIRLLVGKVLGDRIVDSYYDRKITRLGDMLRHSQRLGDKEMDASLAAIEGFSSVIARSGVQKLRAVATSALREASNADLFVRRVSEITGIRIEVISGEQEAALTLKGIIFALRRLQGKPESVLVLDIGGGSTEWMFVRNMRSAGDLISRAEIGSIPAGVIKLVRDYVKNDPIMDSDINALNAAVVSILDDIGTLIGQLLSKNTSFIGTAGTFSTIASIDLGLETYSRERMHLHSVPFSRLNRMWEILRALPIEKRKSVPGLEPERADLIIPGLHFTISVMRHFGFRKLIASEYGLLEGVLLELKETFEKDIPTAG